MPDKPQTPDLAILTRWYHSRPLPSTDELIIKCLVQGAAAERLDVLKRLVKAGKLDSVELKPHFKYRGTTSNDWKDASVCAKCGWFVGRCVCLHNGMIRTVTNA